MSEELSLGLLSALLGSLGLLEGGIGDLLELDGRDVELGGGLDDISTVDSSKRNTVNLEWAYRINETCDGINDIPVTRRRPEGRSLRKTTLLPL